MRTGLHRRHGFTLIELLVVIAIIAILAAILFPVFARARAKARQTQCLSNLKQLGLGVTMYEQDYDEVMPPWGYGDTSKHDDGTNNVVDGFYSWDTLVNPYLRNQQILFCPDNPFGKGLRSYAAARYAFTSCLASESNRFFVVTTGSMPDPSSTIMLFDKGAQLPGMSGDAAGESAIQSHSASTQSGFDPVKDTQMFHNGGKNFVYCDGHAKWAGKGAGPFKADPLNPCPGTGWPGTAPTGYESHGPGHCEFPADWPVD